MNRNLVLSLLVLCTIVLISEARPSYSGGARLKRVVSDQRLAELETRYSLKNMKGRLVTVPVGFGKVDPMKIGRKRRSSTESNLLKLHRILSSILDDDSELTPTERSRYISFLLSRWDELREHEEATRDQDVIDDGYY